MEGLRLDAAAVPELVPVLWPSCRLAPERPECSETCFACVSLLMKIHGMNWASSRDARMLEPCVGHDVTSSGFRWHFGPGSQHPDSRNLFHKRQVNRTLQQLQPRVLSRQKGSVLLKINPRVLSFMFPPFFLQAASEVTLGNGLSILQGLALFMLKIYM